MTDFRHHRYCDEMVVVVEVDSLGYRKIEDDVTYLCPWKGRLVRVLRALMGFGVGGGSWEGKG